MCLNLLPIFFLLAETIASQVSENAGFRVPRVRHQTDNNSWESRRFCNTDQLEYRLTKLEVQVAEKSEGVLSELRESNRRLQALELQSAEVQSAIETFKNELGRFMENHNNQQRYATSDGPSNKLELRVDNLAKGVQLVVANVRRINSDIGAVKSNLSAVARNTNTLLLKHGDLVTKPFLTDSLTDVKHHHVYQQPLKTANSFQCDKDIPRNCKEVLEKGSNTSGIYLIQPKLAPRPFMVLCEMESKGGGWTYVLNRYEGVQDFYLNWRNYKLGFGNLGGEFWLGLEYLHQLTGNEINELLVELVDLDEKAATASYAAFSVGNEVEGYSLKVLAGYSGNAGDSLSYHAGSKFSTKDLDQDEWAEGSCAQAHSGSWWYRNCDTSNLNGRYLKGELPEDYRYKGMYWRDFHGSEYSLLRVRMMIRPRDKSIYEN